MDDAKLTPEELEEMEKQFWEIVRKYRPEISEEKNLIQNNKIYVHMVLPYFTAVNIQYV